MPKTSNIEHTFEHSWTDISFASWLKYPSPLRPDVVCVDLLARDFDPSTGVLKTKRMVTFKPSIPSWLQKLMNTPYLYFIEEATIDPRNNKMELVGKNVSFSSIIEMQEKCVYTPHKENKDWTLLQQEAKVTSFTSGFSRMIEDFCSKTFIQNATKGQKIMEQAVDTMKMWKKETETTFGEIGTIIKNGTEEIVHGVTAAKPRVGILNALPE